MLDDKQNSNFKDLDKPIVLQKSFILRLIAIFSPIVFFVFLFAVWICKERTIHSESMIMAEENARIQLGKAYLEEQLHEINQDVLFMVSQFRIADHGRQDVDLNHIEQAWRSFAIVKNKYEKIRFLDLTGMEQIQVKYLSSSGKILFLDELQDRSDRYYFSSSLELNPNEIYISSFDLVVEDGELVQPYRAILRFATPAINKDGEKKGVVIVNYSGAELLTRFSAITAVELDHSVWLVNNAGYWLKGPTQEVEWGFLTGNYNQTLATLYPDAWSKVSLLFDGQFSDNNGLWTFSTVYPLEEANASSTGSYKTFNPSRSQLQSKEYSWKVVAFIPKEAYLAKSGKMAYKLDVIVIVSLLTLLWFVGSWWLAYHHMKIKNLGSRLRIRVDELRDATKALQVSEKLYSITLRSIGDAVLSTDEKGCVVLMNPAAESLTGWKLAEVVGKEVSSIFEVRNEETGERMDSMIASVLNSGKGGDLGSNLVLVAKEGKRIPVSDSLAPILSDDGSITGVVIVLIEQTKEREMKIQLERSEAQLRSLFANTPLGFALLKIVKDKQGKTVDYKIVKVNPVIEKMLGVENEEVTGKLLFEIIPDFSDEWKCFYLNASKEMKTVEYEAYSHRFTGYYRTKVFSPAPNHIAVLLDNVTDRIETLGKLEDSQKLLRTIIDTLPIRVLWKDVNLRFLGGNIAFAQDVGVKDPNDVVGLSDYDLLPSTEEIEYYRSIDRSVITRKIPKLNFEELQTHRDGSVHDLITNKLPLLNDLGECIGVLVTYEDVTEYNRTRHKLQQLSLAVEESPDAVVITDPEGNIEYVNSAFAYITGYDLKETIGANPRILKSGEHPAEFYEDLWNTISSGEVWNGRFINKRKDGSFYDDETTISSLKNANGAITNYVAIKRDITDQLLLEEKLYQASKMESIGVLAGGIAHQFNNLLQIILGHNELLSFEMKDNVNGLNSVMQIKKSTMRAAELTKDFLTFSEKGFMKITELDVNDILPNIVEYVLSNFTQKINIIFKLSSDIENIRGDERNIELLFENIIENAVEVMSGGGVLTIETYNTEFSKDDWSLSPNVLPGKFVCCSISDTGGGMPQNIKEHLFEPFCSTKELGAGLGLASAYGIIQKHHGWIDVEVEDGVGCTFKIYIPHKFIDKTHGISMIA